MLLMWYAQVPSRAARQVAADVFVLAWCVVWVIVAMRLRQLIASLADPVREIAAGGADAEAALSGAGRDVAGLPIVGDRLAGTFGALAGPGGQVRTAGLQLAQDIETVATATALVVAVAPALALVIPWLVLRTAFARRARACRAMLLDGGGDDLFALRALGRRPLRRLTTVDPDPAGAWRRGEPDVIRDLAALELTSAGLRPAGRPCSAGPDDVSPRG